MRPITLIVIHCSATSSNAPIDAILNYWRTVKKWKNPGYHKIIKPTGEVVQLAPAERITNGVRGYSRTAYHICYIGGRYGIDNRTLAQKQSLATEVKNAMRLFPEAKLCGHRDLSPDLDNNGIIEPHEWTKQCPSFDVAKWALKIGIERRRIYANV